MHSGAGTSAGAGRRAPAPLLASKYVIGSFVCDFGNVLVGGVKRKTFKVTNTSALPATFELDKNIAMTAGFHMEPSKVGCTDVCCRHSKHVLL